MKPAPVGDNEPQRLAAVYGLNLLDTPPEERFDRITRRAVAELHFPISTITLIDKDREWFKSCRGLSNLQGDRQVSFCGHALYTNQIFVIADTLKDKRFADNPLVTGPPYIRFYAGLALHDLRTKMPVGVFCVKDTKPHSFTPDELKLFLELADEAERELNSQPSPGG